MSVPFVFEGMTTGPLKKLLRSAIWLAFLLLLSACAPGTFPGGAELTQTPLPPPTAPLATLPAETPAAAASPQSPTAESSTAEDSVATAPATQPSQPPPAAAVQAAPARQLAPEMAPALPGTAQNFEQIGHTSLGSIGWHGGLALAGSCAYVGNRRASAIAIVDVSDPATPTAAGAIPFPPGAQPAELRTLPAHNLLVVADLAQSPHLYTFDVSDCTAPRQMAALTLHTPLHEFFLWQGDGAAGGQVLLFGATFGQGPPDLLVIDLSVPAAPTERARWTAAAEDAKGALHSLSVSPDGSQAWLALWRGGLLLADVAPPQIALTRNASGGYLPAVFANAHSAVPLAEPGLVLLTSEIYTCPFGGVAIADVRTPARPRLVGGLRLPENRCPARPGDAVFTAHNPLVVGDLVFLTWYGGGLQALDVSDPSAPQRVGQFVPAGAGAAAESYVGRYPVQMWSYPVLRDGLLYVTDIQSGLYVIRYTGPGAEKVAQVARAEGNVTVRK